MLSVLSTSLDQQQIRSCSRLRYLRCPDPPPGRAKSIDKLLAAFAQQPRDHLRAGAGPAAELVNCLPRRRGRSSASLRTRPPSCSRSARRRAAAGRRRRPTTISSSSSSSRPRSHAATGQPVRRHRRGLLLRVTDSVISEVMTVVQQADQSGAAAHRPGDQRRRLRHAAADGGRRLPAEPAGSPVPGGTGRGRHRGPHSCGGGRRGGQRQPPVNLTPDMIRAVEKVLET